MSHSSASGDNSLRRPRIWLDASDLLVWEGHATGIPRTLECLAEIWLSQPDGHLVLCVLNKEKTKFCAIEPAEFRKRWEEKKARTRELAQEALARRLSPPKIDLLPEVVEEDDEDEEDEVPTGPIYRFSTHFPPDLQPRVYDTLGTTLHWVKAVSTFLKVFSLFLLRTLVNPFRWLVGKKSWLSREELEKIRFEEEKRLAREEALRRYPPLPLAEFHANDVLFSAGGGWMRRGYPELLASLHENQGVRCATMIYDIIPCLQPHFFWEGFKDLFSGWVATTLRDSSLILTISQNSRRDILAFAEKLPTGTPLPPVEVVRLGDSLLHEIPGTMPPHLPVDLSRHPFVLSVGTVEIRKNHALLYRVWRELCARPGPPPPPLVIVGRRGWLTGDLIHQMQHDPLVRDHIIILDAANDAELAWLYRHCSFTLYPSLYEGWGLPVAESLVFGKYCIASNVSSIPELIPEPDLITLHDPHDFPGWVRLIERAIQDRAFVSTHEERIRRLYPRTSWESTAQAILARLENLSTS